MSFEDNEKVLTVAIIGSGPSGFYAAEAIFKLKIPCVVHMYERLATPFGLLRGGVAPDHQKLKSISKAYERIASHEAFHFFGNVTIGKDIEVSDLESAYHAVIFASGTETDRQLGIPGESLSGSHTATEFVGWYNGHPDYKDKAFDLSQKKVAIIGQGNVAIDVCRILAKTTKELKTSDIADHALKALEDSQVEDIYLIGRRGPVQSAFTELEIKELGELEEADPLVLSEDLSLSQADQEEIDLPKNHKAQKNVAILSGFSERAQHSKKRRIHIRFFESPLEICGDTHVNAIKLGKNRLEGLAGQQKAVATGETETLDVGLVFRSIGYRGVPINGVPFDEKKGVISNDAGRIIENNNIKEGWYVTGWIKRGPSGVIGTNRADSIETVKKVEEDLSSLLEKNLNDKPDLLTTLKENGHRVISFEDWKRIDEEEVRRGEGIGKPREKFTSTEAMITFLDEEG
ncbi:NADP oxidoreductase [Candidatus Marinamargulisbacteria bacterium SCGC AG-439-L15]|nr:NADP oxidoreductase [Candidatus Marinamargulisbacteria bacterium SCGC AG-439-L15]